MALLRLACLFHLYILQHHEGNRFGHQHLQNNQNSYRYLKKLLSEKIVVSTRNLAKIRVNVEAKCINQKVKLHWHCVLNTNQIVGYCGKTNRITSSTPSEKTNSFCLQRFESSDLGVICHYVKDKVAALWWKESVLMNKNVLQLSHSQ